MGGAKKRAKKKTKKPAQAEIAAKATSRAKPKGKSKDKSKATPEPLYLTEEDVKSLVTVKDAIATLEELFATWSDPATVNLPRQRARAGDSAFNLMGAAWGTKALFGLKAYYIGSGGARSHVLLYSSRDAKLRAMIESDNLGRMRTGAASGVATKLLAKPEARMVGIIGTGQQAFTQVAAVCAVRPIEVRACVQSHGRASRRFRQENRAAAPCRRASDVVRRGRRHTSRRCHRHHQIG